MAEDPSSCLACDLPGEVMLEILSRIPIKSLMRFKCVSKAWYFLAENPFFIKKHFAYPHEIEGDGFLVIGQDTEFTIGIIPPGSNKWESMEIHLPYKAEYIGHSHGLICMTPLNKANHGSEILVLNPARRESIHIHKKIVCEGKPQLMSIGFGFDPEQNDFKIVRIEQFEEESRSWRSEVNVYSLKTNSWKKINCAFTIKLASRIGMQSCNLMCWRSNPCRELTAFSLSSERFYRIPVPGHCLRIESKQNSIGAVISENENYSAHDSKFWKWYSSLSENRTNPQNPCLSEFSWEKRGRLLEEEFDDKILKQDEMHKRAIDLGFQKYNHIINAVTFKESLEPVKRVMKLE